MRIWTWRVQHPDLPLYMKGTEFWEDEARKQGLLARGRMANAYELRPSHLKLTVRGPRGGVQELRHVSGTRAGGRWVRRQ